MNKTVKTILRALLTLSIWLFGIFLLYKYEYLTYFNDIDNIIGMIPVALVITGAAGLTFIIWIRYTKPLAPVLSFFLLLTVMSVALFPTALRGNWWIAPKTSNLLEAKPDLLQYAPFKQGSSVAKLHEKSTLILNDNLPVLDGVTALYPVYSAFAQAVYDENAYTPNKVICTNTKNAYESVISGKCDIIFVAGASKKQQQAAAEAGADLVFTPIGHEAFVFLVGKENPIDDISYQQLRCIYSGKIAKWNSLGWRGGGKIAALQRPEGSGSQTGLQNMVMNGLPVIAPQPVPDAIFIETNSLMRQISTKWNGVQPVLGYSYRFYAAVMYSNPNAKMLKINGIEPTVKNIQNGSYPFIGNFYAVTRSQPTGNTKLLIDWILSPQGQELIEKTGYTPLLR